MFIAKNKERYENDQKCNVSVMNTLYGAKIKINESILIEDVS